MRRIVIIGAGGHGKVVADIARQYYEQIDFLDDNPKSNVIGPVSDYVNYLDRDFFVAIGNNEVREKVIKKLKNTNIVSLVHKNAVVANDVIIGEGTVVVAGAVINPGTVIGNGCIINTCSSVDHDCEVGDFSHISVGVHLAGAVKVGKYVFVGAGAIIKNNIEICDNVVVGAGAVVINNIEENGTYIGVPARKMRFNTKKIGGGVIFRLWFSATNHLRCVA